MGAAIREGNWNPEDYSDYSDFHENWFSPISVSSLE